ncbi:MAG TPA: DEAD/DEAH box helicase, partial [Thermoanaerobaculia bacterium]|nr:DEAD/DEAH box helicase [Thermoanaerobaculia bacterium]
MPGRSAADPALSLFHPVVQEWFAEEVGTPTDVQRRAWPEIAAGRHVLVTAPTGTGKTLTAFLWALDRFLTGALETGATRVLYVSPLKALNADIRRNLDEPLARLSARFREAGLAVPGVRALVRSGDTPQGERQKMLRRPPEILITTPESLNILLTSLGGRSLLGGLETVILDEIHAVAGTKRGTHLMTAVERLVPLSGEFQRIALSATVRPLATVAEFVGGLETLPATGPGARAGEAWSYRKRPVTVVRSEAEKVYDLRVRFPGSGDPSAPREEDPEASVWDRIVPELEKTIRRNRSTLVFANSRRTTEKLTRMVNAGQSEDLAYSHHGSLSREVRQVVEERLKRGELPAIVATSSLELGIDVGALDEVVLVQTPPTVASAIQRIGRAGHRVGAVSRGTLFPTHGRDFLSAAVVARAVLDREIEAVRPPEAPLDVLAQVILSMTATEAWDLEELFGTLRGMWPYRNLPRRHFDLVLEMLAGRYADSRIRELAPRVTVDRVEGTVRARPGVERLVYLSGGTIPDRGYYSLRVDTGGAGEGPKIGELDEEFVWERLVGDTFTLGTQIWRVRRITHNDVFVEPGRGSAAMAPFWRADLRDREYFLAERIGRFLEAVEERLVLRFQPPLDRLQESPDPLGEEELPVPQVGPP